MECGKQLHLVRVQPESQILDKGRVVGSKNASNTETPASTASHFHPSLIFACKGKEPNIRGESHKWLYLGRLQPESQILHLGGMVGFKY